MRTASTAPSPSTVTLYPSADTYGNEGAPSTNYGTTSSLTARGSLGASSYLKFAIPATPAGKRLVKAELKLRTTSDSFAGSNDPFLVQLSSSIWDETGLTWLNKPLPEWTLGQFSSLPAASSVYAAQLNPDVITWLSNSSQTLAVTSAGTDSAWFWSSDHANQSYRPQLVLMYQ